MARTQIRPLRELRLASEATSEAMLSGARNTPVPKKVRLPASATPKELDLLQALALVRYADSDRLQIAVDLRKAIVNRRLRVLRNKRLVSWFRWVDEEEQEDDTVEPLSSKAVYVLSPKGAERLILSGRLPASDYLLTRPWRGKPVLHSQMPHQIGVSDLILRFSVAGRKSDSHEFVQFIPDMVDREIEVETESGKEKKNISATFELYDSKYALKPDLIAHARAKNSGKNFTLYFELERKYRSPPAIKKKFESYSVAFPSSKRFHNYGPPLLLYVTIDCVRKTETDKRVKDLCRWASESPIAPAFRVARFSDVQRDPLGPIWVKSNGEVWSIRK